MSEDENASKQGSMYLHGEDGTGVKTLLKRRKCI
jgi:hypothetical protein